MSCWAGWTGWGWTPSPTDLVTSAGAVASLLQPGESVKVLAEGGVLEALAARGVHTDDGDRAVAAVVGWSRSFDFDSLAATAVGGPRRPVGCWPPTRTRRIRPRPA